MAGVLAEDPDRAAIGDPVALQDLHRGRLAGPVRAEEGDDLAGPDIERDAVEDRPRPVALHDVDEGQRGGAPRAGRRRHGAGLPAGPEIEA